MYEEAMQVLQPVALSTASYALLVVPLYLNCGVLV